jgi:uncharacterized membrane protein YvbJ
LKKCPTCGAEVADDEVLCGVCGNPLDPDELRKRHVDEMEKRKHQRSGKNLVRGISGIVTGIVMMILGGFLFFFGTEAPAVLFKVTLTFCARRVTPLQS